ncbi:ATP-binding protein [bacterium]|nr:ATP-binding protein [bacterium]
MIITVASGKGGTGKTTIATNLAKSVGQTVRLLDCDVEEPNAHLFINPEHTTSTPVKIMVPKVDQSLCTLCGACEEICQFSAINLIAGKIMTFPEMCHSCKGCLMVCPTGAISESSRELGEIIHGSMGSVDLYYGKLRVGEAMSPPLIEKVKMHSDRDGITIIDAPPGTSCPVISALRSSDFVLLVTEPTPFGLNDLKLAVETVRTLNLPMGLVINRSDVGDDNVKAYAADEKIPILLEIPDRRDIAEHYSRGIAMVDALPEMKKVFEDLYTTVKNLIPAA